MGAFRAPIRTGHALTYSLFSNPGNLFALSGKQILVVNGALDFEAASSRTITVRATDTGGLTFDQTFTIAIGNVNEAPTNIALSNTTVAENSAVNTVVGALSGSDPDGNALTYRCSAIPAICSRSPAPAWW